MADEQQGVRVLGRKDDEEQLYGSVQLKAQDKTLLLFASKDHGKCSQFFIIFLRIGYI